MPAQQRPVKSRNAPNFKSRHLEPHRARKLKKEWLATQKIKAAYRAEKRRLGLRKPTASTDDNPQNDGTRRLGGTAAEAELPDEELSEHDESDQSSIGEDDDSHPIVKDNVVSKPPSDTAHPREKGKNKGKPKENPAILIQSAGPSLRELAREAYSPASLHTHKSNPLHRKHRETHGVRGATGGRGRGRGQPDMAKRMGVLLEQIKRRS